MKIHHIGYLVHDIHKSAGDMKLLGFTAVSEICYDELRDIDILFLDNGGYVVELVQPKSEKSVVWNQLKRSGNTPYHFCYIAEDMDAAIADFKKRGGYKVMRPPLESPPLDNRKVVFLYNINIGIVELIEKA
jgi:methylmalonyl-CoA/ethylmalonyl-CoA epimerase